MNRMLQLINLIGVFALVVLCGTQWRTNVTLHENLTAAQTALADQSTKITEQQKAIEGATADVEEFRAHLVTAEQLAKDTQSKLDQITAERDAALTDRDQWKATVDSLKSALDKWTAAVAARDQALKQANDLAQKLSADRNAAIQKFNDLVAKYNTLVTHLPATQPAPTPPNPSYH